MAKIFIITGPSGVGKDSIVNKLKSQGFKFNRVITTTTRKKRKGEIEGKSYYFVSKEKFKKMIEEKKFIEWAEVYKNYYGTQKKDVQKVLKKKLPIIMIIDVQGAKTWKKAYPKKVLVIFIKPPSLKILEKRLRKRSQDSEINIKIRLKKAKEEMKNLKQWDKVVINKENHLEETVDQVKKIIISQYK